MIDNPLPMVGKLLQRAYTDRRRAYTQAAAALIPTMTPWLQRRSSKRRAIPGVIDVPTDSEG